MPAPVVQSSLPALQGLRPALGLDWDGASPMELDEGPEGHGEPSHWASEATRSTSGVKWASSDRIGQPTATSRGQPTATSSAAVQRNFAVLPSDRTIQASSSHTSILIRQMAGLASRAQAAHDAEITIANSEIHRLQHEAALMREELTALRRAHGNSGEVVPRFPSGTVMPTKHMDAVLRARSTQMDADTKFVGSQSVGVGLGHDPVKPDIDTCGYVLQDESQDAETEHVVQTEIVEYSPRQMSSIPVRMREAWEIMLSEEEEARFQFAKTQSGLKMSWWRGSRIALRSSGPLEEDTADDQQTCHSGRVSRRTNSQFSVGSVRPVAVQVAGRRWVFHVALHPQSVPRVIWDLCCMLLVLYDAVTVPLQVFDLPESSAWLVVAVVGAAFWTIDVLMSCITGVYIDGELKLSLPIIIKSYARSWLVPDIGLVVLEWLACLGGNVVGVAGTTRTARYLRVLRAVRVTRLYKLLPMMQKFEDTIISASVLLVFKIMKIVVGLVLLNHAFACLWFELGVSQPDGWVQQDAFADQPQLYLYLTAMHWSLTQFHGAMTLDPGNTWERGYAAVVLVTAFVCYSAFVSTVTSLMWQIHMLQQTRMTLKQQLHQFLEAQHLSSRLLVRLKRFIRVHGAEVHKKQQHNAFLDLLPETLLKDVHVEVRMPTLASHNFFADIIANHKRAAAALCHGAAREVLPVSGDIIFQEGDEASCMYFLVDGVMQYTLYSICKIHDRTSNGSIDVGVRLSRESAGRSSTASTDSKLSFAERPSCQPPQEMTKGSWVSEAVLWLPWEHLGEFFALTPASMVLVEHASFASILTQHREQHVRAVLYARRYIEHARAHGWAEILPQLHSNCA